MTKIPYVCIHCRASFPDSLALNHHLADKHNPLLGQASSMKSAFTCSICDHAFTRRDLLNAHLVAVHAVKPGIETIHVAPISRNRYSCSTCDLDFDGYGDLGYHYQNNHNGRTLVCVVCDCDLTPPDGSVIIKEFGKIAHHLDSHKTLPNISTHSLAYTPVTQEFYELAAMRGQSLLTTAIDLIEEYIVSNGAPDTEIPFQSWYGNNVYRHLERHLPFPPHQNAHVPKVKLSHSSDYKPVTQEFYELAAMREQSLRDMALDLLEEYYSETYADSVIDWRQYQIWMEKMLRARGHTMKEVE
jgi:hypothetical protein